MASSPCSTTCRQILASKPTSRLRHPQVVQELESDLAAWNAEMGEPSWPAFRSTLDEIDGEMVHLFF